MRITSKGQVTIPVEIRERPGLLAKTEVGFQVVGQRVRIRKKVRQYGQGRRGKWLAARLPRGVGADQHG